ncbi:MAG: hypothetical protein Kow0040_15650 [Thermogutta sp.]
MPVKKKRSVATGPLVAGGITVVLVVLLGWFIFLRPKPKPVVTEAAASDKAAAPARPAVPNPGPAPNPPSGLAERVARLEAFLPADAEPTEDLIARLDRLEARIEQLQSQLDAKTGGSIINEWRVSAQSPDSPPAVSSDFLVTRPVWRVACRVAKEVGPTRQVLVQVFLRQEPDRVIAEVPANSSIEIRGRPGVYFFRVTAVGADVVVAWES